MTRKQHTETLLVTITSCHSTTHLSTLVRKTPHVYTHVYIYIYGYHIKVIIPGHIYLHL